MKFHYRINSHEHTLVLEKQGVGYRARLGERSFAVELLAAENGELRFRLDGDPLTVHTVSESPTRRWLQVAGRTFSVEKASANRRSGSEGALGGGRLSAPMPGQIRAVLVAEGDEVTPGQPLLLMEAMKMEIRIAAPHAGRVAKLYATEGATVNKDDVLVEIEEVSADA